MKVPGRVRYAISSIALGIVLPTLVASTASAATRESGSPSTNYVVPHVKVGDRIATVFSKTIAVTIPGFDPKVSRTSGTDTIVIRSIGAGGIAADESYVYDGGPTGRDVVEVRDGGWTNCVDGKCRTNDQTSAPLFNSLLWGAIPHHLTVGRRWSADIGKPWEIGPAGTEVVTVTRLDPAQGLVTLFREGTGNGPSTDDARMASLTITGGGRSMKVKVVPGRAHWSGSATIVQGVTLADQIMIERPLDLATEDGQHIAASQRTYTIFIRAEAAGVAA